MIASDWLVMPFEEFIDWKQFAIFVPEWDARSAMLRLPHIPTEEIRRRRLALGCVRQVLPEIHLSICSLGQVCMRAYLYL